MATVDPSLDQPRLFRLGPVGAEPARQPGPGRPEAGHRPLRRAAPTLLAVDGEALAQRALQAAGGDPDRLAAGRRHALALLARLAEQTQPTGCLVGFDDQASSWRRALRPAYKAVRPPRDPVLAALAGELPGLLGDLGLAVAVPRGLEAGDVLGSAAAAATRHGVPAVLATSDQAVFALVSPTVRVLLLLGGCRIEQVSPSWVRARYGVGADAYLAFAALRGDAGDCLPGVRGISPVAAAGLLAAYPDVEGALADAAGVARLLGPWVAEALVNGRSTYEANWRVMALHTDVPLDLEAARRPLDARTVTAVLHAAGVASEELAGLLVHAFRLLGRAAWRHAAAI